MIPETRNALTGMTFLHNLVHRGQVVAKDVRTVVHGKTLKWLLENKLVEVLKRDSGFSVIRATADGTATIKREDAKRKKEIP